MDGIAEYIAYESLVKGFRPKISVITVCLNARRHITRCLASVAGQKRASVQHIVVDGLSTDGTVDIVSSFPHVSLLISERDDGIYSAMNKGLRHVTGDYVIFLNADDCFLDETVLSDVVDFLENNPVDLAYGSILVQTPYADDFIFSPRGGLEEFETLAIDPLPHQGTFARRRLYQDVGGFSRRFRILADYEWFLRVFASPGVTFARIPRTIATYSMAGASADPAKRLPEFFRIQQESALFGSASSANLKLSLFQQRITDLECRLFDLQRQRGSSTSNAPRSTNVAHAGAWQNHPCYGGLYDDGWASPHLLVHYGSGPPGRIAELQLQLPDWLPYPQVEMTVLKNDDESATRHILRRTDSPSISVPIGERPGFIDVQSTPYFRPMDVSGGKDARALTLIVQKLELRSDDDAIVLFSKTTSA